MRLWIVFALAVVCSACAGSPGFSGSNRMVACQKADDEGDDERAISACSEALRVPDLSVADKAEALVNRCVAYFYLEKYESALADCDASLAMVPNDAHALEFRGQSYDHLYRYDEAIRDFNRAIELKPKDGYLHIARGLSYYGSGNPDQAIQDYDRALEIGGNDGKAYYRRGAAFLAKGETHRAMEDFKRSVPLNAADHNRVKHAAYGAFYLGDYAVADKYFSKLTDRDSFDALYQYFSRKHAGLGAPTDALDGKELKPDEWPSQVLRYVQGKSSKAEVLSATANLDATIVAARQCEAEFFIGEMELLARNKDDARQHLNNALKICPKIFFELTAARAELTRL